MHGAGRVNSPEFIRRGQGIQECRSCHLILIAIFHEDKSNKRCIVDPNKTGV